MPPRRSSRSSNQSEPSIKQYFTQPERTSKRIKREHESPVKQETDQPVKEEDENQPIKLETRRSIKHEDSSQSMKDEQSVKEEKNAVDDDDQLDDEPDDDYEALRLANIRRNADQLRQLSIPSLVLTQPSQPSQPRRQSVRAPKPETQPVRRSMRNRGLNPDNTIADVVREAEAEAEAEKIRREGPIDMNDAIVVVRGRNFGLMSQYDPDKSVAAAEQVEEEEEDVEVEGENEEKKSEHNPLTDRLCSTVSSFNAERSTSQSNIPSLTEHRIKSFELVGMTNKLTKKRTSAMVFHPSSSLDRSILLTGDKSGLLNVSVFDSARHLQKTDDRNFGVCLNAHDGTINNILCHSFSQRVFTSSNDGFIRSLDVDRQSIAAAFSHDQCLYGLVSPADSPHMIYASDIRGSLIGLDSRANPLTESSQVTLHTHKVGHIDISPLHPHLLASSSNDRTVAIWDLRAMREKEPLHSFVHGYSVTSAMWSPGGSYLLSTSIDNQLRLFQTDNQLVNEWPEPLKIYHDNKTGRWVTQFRARWTMTDEAFTIGNMQRKVDVFHLNRSQSSKSNKSSVPMHGCFSLTSGDLTAIPSVTAIHPSNQILAASTASGYAYLWQTSV